MSHNIESYKYYKKINDNGEFEGKNISELNYSKGNDNSYIIYILLDSLKYHAEWSGSGESKEYSIKNINKALQELNKIKRFLVKNKIEMKREKLKKITIKWG